MDIKNPTAPCIMLLLPCETLMSAKQAINYKWQGSVATYLRCRGDVKNQIAESEWKKFKSVNILQSYKQERGCLMHFAHLWPTHC